MTTEQIRIIADADAAADVIAQRISARALPDVARALAPLTVPQIVSVCERLAPNECAVMYRLLPKQAALEVFESLPPTLQGDLVQALRDAEVAAIFADLEPDDRVWLLDELPASLAPRLLHGLPEHERLLTAAVLGYPPVLDDGRRVVGVVSLRDLLASDAHALVETAMSEAHTAEASEDAETAARRCADLRLLALPIVDSESRLVGILTIDDAVRILEREESEDAARQGGAEPLRRPYLSTPIRSIVRSRVVWLLVLAVGASLTVQVLSAFEATLAQVTVLALFVPLLIGTGGNTGNQAATTVTRALALGDVRPRDILRVLSREVRVGCSLGLVLGSLGFAVAGSVYEPRLGAVIGLTLVAVCTAAAAIGGIMPLVARAVHVDPAVFSNPFISTFVDATGLVIYFLVARLVLGI